MYQIELKIAKAKQPQTIADELIVPCAKYIVKCITSEEISIKINPKDVY